MTSSSSSTVLLGSSSTDYTAYYDMYQNRVNALMNYIDQKTARYAELETNLNKKMNTQMSFLSDFVSDIKRAHRENQLSAYRREEESKKLYSHRNEYSNIFNSEWEAPQNRDSPNMRAFYLGDPFRAGPLKDATLGDWNECFNEVDTLSKLLLSIP